MAVSETVKNALKASSMIRKMFEEGMLLKKQHGADKVFDFSLGNPDVDPPKEFHDVFVKLAQEDEKGSHGYMPNAGFMYVREALAKKVSRQQNVAADGSCIVMAAGAAAGLNAVFKAICSPGDEIIVSRPCFVEYRAYAANHNAKLVEVDTLDDFNLNIEAIGAALNEKTAAVLINSPNNPTGKVYPAGDLDALAALLNSHGKKTGRLPYLVSDEPYREIAYNIDVPPFLSCYSESIVVSSYSKNLSLPGERIGYIALNPQISGKDELVNAFAYCARVLGFVNAPAFMQRIVARLTEAKIDVSIYAKRRDIFMKVLDDAGIKYCVPQGAFYLFCKVPGKLNRVVRQPSGFEQLPLKNAVFGSLDQKTARLVKQPTGLSNKSNDNSDIEFVEHLKKHLILGVPGSAFGKSGWLRFAYCMDEKVINASADSFKAAMRSWQ